VSAIERQPGTAPLARDRILLLLRVNGPRTAEELAARLGVGPAAVRAQLRGLESAGLVARSVETRPIGRPVGRYGLTSRADALFPKRYEMFASHLLDAIVAESGPEGLRRILARWEEELAARLDAELPQEPAARLAALAAHQTEHGFMAEVTKDADGFAIVERNCPIAEIARRHPEICDHEAALFGRTLKWKTTLVSCHARGGGTCVFRIGRARGA
jgi:predicted ArsR family transcriptional regulator